MTYVELFKYTFANVTLLVSAYDHKEYFYLSLTTLKPLPISLSFYFCYSFLKTRKINRRQFSYIAKQVLQILLNCV